MVKWNKLYKGIAVTITLGLTMSLFSVAKASEYDLEKQLELLDKEIQQKESILTQKKKQENSALLELRKINKTLDNTSSKLKYTEQKLSNTEKDLKILQQEIKESEENLDGSRDVLSGRLRSIYEQGDVHILEVLLDSSSITDFLTRWDLLKKLAENDMSIIDSYNKELQTFQDKQNLALTKKNTLLKLKQDQDNAKHELAVASSRQKELYKNIQSERSVVEQALDDLEEQSRLVAQEIRRLTGGDNSAYLGSGKFAWPTPGNTRITSSYGWRIHPILKTRRIHTGVDIAAPHGSNIVAAETGKVIFTGWKSAYGNVVMVSHGGDIVTFYAHSSKILVKTGQTVTKGQPIALIGTTGWSTGPHLHFEVRKNGEHTNPIPYLK